ncbi:MAG: NAD(P)-binding domain-containing protein [Sphingomonas sp.]|uniref:NADPH-dependent F420 reductase n=1 Tax=Sphingomonas sp. TaxID=28214 RepID=UPI0025F47DEA|nr:NAD(P)-binding domain-containing protein [Sphingomonas sp.]MBY0284073.1 NAD(P)-binding domain-containing protein [Sphingomonas sp.]
MKIGIIGAGNIGTGLGKRLAAKGHDIVVSYARTPEKVAEATAVIGGGAKPGSPEEAVAHGEVIILATPWGVTLDVVRSLAGEMADKIVWDCTNPFAPDMSELLIGTTTSAGEEIAKAAPLARIVKAVPPFAQSLHAPSMDIGGHKPGVFVCGDDPAARATVVQLVSDVDADGVDAGPLKLARFTEPLGMLVTNLAYAQGMGPAISAILVR